MHPNPSKAFRSCQQQVPHLYSVDSGGGQLPTLFVFEGGYAISEVGVNTVNVLSGFESA